MGWFVFVVLIILGLGYFESVIRVGYLRVNDFFGFFLMRVGG